MSLSAQDPNFYLSPGVLCVMGSLACSCMRSKQREKGAKAGVFSDVAKK